MIRTFLNQYGAITQVISGDEENVELNTPEDTIYVDVQAEDPTDYWDFGKNCFVSIGPVPEPFMEFNYELREWHDPRSIEQVKEDQWKLIKAERDALEFGGFTFNGHVYDSDQISQGRISTAASLGIPVEWTLADNSTTWLEPEDLQALVVALAQHVTSVHARGKIAKEAISNATTVDDVKAVVL